MTDTVELVSYLGTLRMSRPVREVLDELKFKHTFADTVVKRYFDKAQGKMVEREVRDGYTSTTELLYSITPEGYVVTHNGMLSVVGDILNSLGTPYTYERQGTPWPVPVITPAVFRGLWDTQVEAVIQMLSSVGGAMIEAATSAGKTRIIAALVRAFPRQKIVIATHRQAVVRGLVKNLNELLAEDGVTVGMCQGPTNNIRRVTVATIATLDRFEADEVDVLIGDEFHRFAGLATAEKWLTFERALKFGLSATIKDRFDGKFKFLQSLCGPMVCELTDQQVEAAGQVCPLRAYFLSVPEGEELDHLKPEPRMKRGIWRNPIRNDLIRLVAERAPVDQQMLVFVSTIEHLEMLKANHLPDFQFCHAELPDKERLAIEEGFTNGTIKRLISTDCLSEGVDPKNLMIMVDASGIKGDSAQIQKRGRLRRWAPGKTYGVLVNFCDEWSEKLGKRAQTRISEHKKRGDTVIIGCSPEDLEFVDLSNAEALSDGNLAS